MASVLVLGDSQVKYLGQKKTNLTVWAFPGSQVQNLVIEASRIVPSFDVVVLHVGTNNVSSVYQSASNIVRRYACLIDAVRNANVNATVFVSAVLPRHADGFAGTGVPSRLNEKAQSVNAGLRALCRDEGVNFLELWEPFLARQLIGRDGLHLSIEDALLTEADNSAGN